MEDCFAQLTKWWKIINRKRMYELAYKYKHTLKLITITFPMSELGKTKIFVDNNVKEMMMIDGNIFISPDERDALYDWINVLNGKPPLYRE